MHYQYKTPGEPLQPAERPIPERFQRIIDRVLAFDRQWFLDNLGQERFVRDVVPGEFLDLCPHADMTLVTNFGGHLRFRTPVAEKSPSANGLMRLVDLSGEEIIVPVVRLSDR